MKQIIQTQKVIEGIVYNYTLYREPKRELINYRWVTKINFKLVIQWKDNKRTLLHREALILTMWDLDPQNYKKGVSDICGKMVYSSADEILFYSDKVTVYIILIQATSVLVV